MCEKSKGIFALIVVFAVDERKIVVEESTNFAAGFCETLLLEDDCYSALARILNQFFKISAAYIWLQSWYLWRWYFSVSLFQPSASPSGSPFSSHSCACWTLSSCKRHCASFNRSRKFILQDIKSRCQSSSLQSSKPWQRKSYRLGGQEQGSRLPYFVYLELNLESEHSPTETFNLKKPRRPGELADTTPTCPQCSNPPPQKRQRHSSPASPHDPAYGAH